MAKTVMRATTTAFSSVMMIMMITDNYILTPEDRKLGPKIRFSSRRQCLVLWDLHMAPKVNFGPFRAPYYYQTAQ